MGKLRVLSGQELCAILGRHGFTRVRQRGSHIRPGVGVAEARDHTLFALVQGQVLYERVGKDGRRVSVTTAP